MRRRICMHTFGGLFQGFYIIVWTVSRVLYYSYFRYRQNLENKIQYSPCMVFVYFNPSIKARKTGPLPGGCFGGPAGWVYVPVNNSSAMALY